MYTQYFTFTWSLVSGVRVTRSLIWCVCVVWIVVCPFVLFLLAIVLYVLRYADSDYSCGIFKLFYNYLLINSPSVRRSFTNLLILQGCFPPWTHMWSKYSTVYGDPSLANLYPVYEVYHTEIFTTARWLKERRHGQCIDNLRK
jgi:hypothetical protein